jgi:hypothetical protein
MKIPQRRGTYELQRSSRGGATIGACMNENADFAAKLHEIEALANALSAELGTQIARTRALHIAILARSLRARLASQGPSIAPTSIAPPCGRS